MMAPDESVSLLIGHRSQSSLQFLLRHPTWEHADRSPSSFKIDRLLDGHKLGDRFVPISASNRDREIVVFSATRYRCRDKHVYPVGNCHLFGVNLDGTGLRQLTSGPLDDEDPIAFSGSKLVLFRRNRQDSEWSILYKLNLSNLRLTKLEKCRVDDDLTWITRKYFRTGAAKFQINTYGDGMMATIRPSGNVLRRFEGGDIDEMSPGFDAVLTGERRKWSSVVDLTTGRISPLPEPGERWVWLDNKTLLCRAELDKGAEEAGIAVADRNSKLKWN